LEACPRLGWLFPELRLFRFATVGDARNSSKKVCGYSARLHSFYDRAGR